MIDDTINDGKTIAGGGKDVVLGWMRSMGNKGIEERCMKTINAVDRSVSNGGFQT